MKMRTLALFRPGAPIFAAVALLLPSLVHAATLTVQNLADSGPGSLRQAIADAAPGDTINFAANVTGTITLTTGELLVDKNLTIAGPGSSALTVSGNNASRIFNLTNASATVAISGLAIANGRFLVPQNSMSGGGGLRNAGTLTLSNCVFAGNTVALDTNTVAMGGAIYSSGPLVAQSCAFQSNAIITTIGGHNGGWGGGAIFAEGALTASDCRFSSNRCLPIQSHGGAIYSVGNAAITRCAFTGNNSSQEGGAVWLAGIGTLTASCFSSNSATWGGGLLTSWNSTVAVSNCTFARNEAWGGGGIYNNSGAALTLQASTIASNTATYCFSFACYAGGLQNDGAATVGNSIIAANQYAPLLATDFPDVKGAFVSIGYNLIGRTNGSTGFGLAGSQDQVGSNTNPLDPLLGPLQDNGGPTPTMRPLPGSPAIDKGFSGGGTDQRGRARPFDQAAVPNAPGGDGSDIGAVEIGAPLIVSNLNDSGMGSLRQAINDAPSDEGDPVIIFATGVTGTLTLTSGELLIGKSLSILGPCAKQLTISGNNSHRVFNIQSGTVNISGLTIAHGNAGATFGNYGGGVYNQAALNLDRCVIRSNTAYSGGGIVNASAGTLTVNECAVFDNSAPNSGGGIFNGSFATLSVTNSTVSGNQGGVGGGIFNANSLTIESSTIANNRSTLLPGGGVYNSGTAALKNSILARNTGSGGPDASGNFISQGYNLIGTTNGNTGFTNGVNGDLAGSMATPLDPLLGPLADYGGCTPTHRLLSGSPALDKGRSSGLSTDQRGAPTFADDAARAIALRPPSRRDDPRRRRRQRYRCV